MELDEEEVKLVTESRATVASSSQEVAVSQGSIRSPPTKGATDAEGDDAEDCGCWMIRPRFLRNFRTAKWVLFFMCWAGAAQGMVVNGFLNASVSTIERRFGLQSWATGIIVGGYDVASFVCLLPVSFLGGRLTASKPAWLGGGILILGIGSLVFSAPQYFAGLSIEALDAEANGVSTFVCAVGGNATTGQGDLCSSRDPLTPSKFSHLSLWFWIFFLGQILHGVGSSPLYTLGVTFIDECVTKKMSSVYLGIFYATAILGPAAGFIVGGQLLNIHTDIFSVDVAEIGITPESGLWVGAWWIGFVLSAMICVVIAIPLLAFPPSLPGAKAIQAQKVCEAHAGGDDAIGGTTALATGNVRGLPAAFRSLIANPTFSFLTLAGAVEGLFIAGFAAFLPKIIENQLGINASSASLLMGLVTVPAGGGATFLGGYLVKHFNLKCSGIIKACILFTTFGLLFTCGFFLNCPNSPLAGVTAPYNSSTLEQHSLDNITLPNSCNMDCGCKENDYYPICGADGNMYYSPCYAGCKQEESIKGLKAYKSCDCITPQGDPLKVKFPDGIEDELPNADYVAVNQLCHTSCNIFWPFIVLVFFVMVFTFLSTMPALSATLRCVKSSQRSFALGFQWLIVRILGTIPAPLLFGAFIDSSCLLWQKITDCNEATQHGACRKYDNFLMSRYMVAVAFSAKAVALIFFFLAWWFYVPPRESSSEKLSEKASSPMHRESESFREFPRFRKILDEDPKVNYGGNLHTNSDLKALNGHVDISSEGFV
ncbi:solute carrier organic anion transporter family member 4A1 isoform X2 [Ischnura elegans]|uniref:solute carrier organic anion transporter family member 4A1 isoform X2 n=1 Tax=Ischnura elegans TaxID=197161 RepID=UPI001ED8A767|nr:solute carrier organic anion transporter family member 4A1 isoform X2 [Ischnura elegans]